MNRKATRKPPAHSAASCRFATSAFSAAKADGCGAWQIGARFSYLDLNDRAIQGGTVSDLTLGLNWFLNPNMRFQLNYILERRDQANISKAWINGVGLRGGFDF